MIRAVLPLLSALASLAFARDSTPQVHCGTARAAQRWIAQHVSGQAASARVSASSLPSARSYSTTHFVFHYSLAPDVNRVKLVARDSVLKRKADSILQSLPASWIKARRDSALHASLNAINAPQPLFVQRSAVYFERAHAYYVDSLGMDGPRGGDPDRFYNVTSDGTRYTVFIGDANTLDPSNALGDPIYGFTYPDHSTLLDNDFLYQASWNGDSVSGSPILSVLNGEVLYDYTMQWDLGIKITASHEFYHSIQFTYVTSTQDYHAWYELSAVGMEERLVPESKDYFQYLPSVLGKHEKVSLLAALTTENYGNATFHQYLTRVFGRAFDVRTWAALGDNNDNLPAALNTLVQSYGARWDTLYAAYAAAMATAGRAGSAATCTDTTSVIFTRDIRCWPTPAYDTLTSNMNPKNLSAAALTYRFVKPLASGKAASISLTKLSAGAQRVERHSGVYSTVSLSGSGFLLPPSPDSSVLFLSIANPSFTQSGQMSLSLRSLGFSAFPNPATPDATVAFFAPSGTAAGTLLTVVSQSGRRVAELPLTTASGSGDSWTWNLRDERNRAVPPGTYFYRVPGQSLKTLLILAH